MDKEFRSIIVQACRKMLNEDLVKGTWGNVSFTDGERIYITPSGYPYDKMKEEDVIVIDYEGNVIEGSRVPSSEWKMHVAIYKARKDVKFILHTHPIYASIASVTMEEVPSLIEDSAMICGPEIRVAKYADPGSWELAENAAEALGNNSAVHRKKHTGVHRSPEIEQGNLPYSREQHEKAQGKISQILQTVKGYSKNRCWLYVMCYTNFSKPSHALACLPVFSHVFYFLYSLS